MANATYDNISITPYDGSEEPQEPTEPEDKLNIAFSDDFSKEVLSDSWEKLNQSNANWALSDGEITAESISSDYSQISLKEYVYTDATIEVDMTQNHGEEDKWSYISFRRTSKTDGIWNSGYFVFYNQAKGWLKLLLQPLWLMV